jgi:hypothetical protein
MNANMKRRAFITLLGSAAAWPSRHGHSPRRPGNWILASPSPAAMVHGVAALRRGVKGPGFVEGQKLKAYRLI